MANRHGQLRSSARVRVQHGSKIELQVGIAVQHEDVGCICLLAGQAYRAAGPERLTFHRIAQREAAIMLAKISADRLVTITRSENRGREAGSDQLIENERKERAPVDRRHGLGNVVHDATQPCPKAAREDDRLHQDDLGNSCASMIWQIACPMAMCPSWMRGVESDGTRSR